LIAERALKNNSIIDPYINATNHYNDGEINSITLEDLFGNVSKFIDYVNCIARSPAHNLTPHL
jgi:hypothetical protein